MSMTSFDRRNNDEAYANLLENTIDEMATSHQIKRFFQKFMLVGNWLFRTILLELFIWRQPNIIILFADTMVMNNENEKASSQHTNAKKARSVGDATLLMRYSELEAPIPIMALT